MDEFLRWFDWLEKTETPLAEICVRLGLALIAGIVIGLDREIRGKPAGLRTHMLVGLASAAFTLIAIEMIQTISEDSSVSIADPTRVIQAVVAGVAFLGAGAIIQAQGSVVGITTGASVWLIGAVGLACGAGYYSIAGITLVLAFATLTIISYIEAKMHRHVLGGDRNDKESDGAG